MAFKIIGGALALWGVADFGFSFMGKDLWYDLLGIQLTGLVYSYSAYAALVAGLVIFNLGGAGEGEDAE